MHNQEHANNKIQELEENLEKKNEKILEIKKAL